MPIKQISVFLENTKGRMASVTKTLSEKDIDIRALSVADTTDFGIMRIIVSDPDKAYSALSEGGFTVSQTDVVGVKIADKPGELAKMLALLSENEMSVEYIYVFLGKHDSNAYVIMKINNGGDNQIAQDLLISKGFFILDGKDIGNI